jgi:hypothetical protein
MRSKVCLFLPVLALSALLAAPVASPAKAKAKPKATPKASVRTLSGQVTGAGFPSGTRVAVPVLLDYASRRRARLRSPLAMLKLPRTATVRGPKGVRLTLAQLRTGDAFKAVLPVPRAARAAAYPAMNAVSTKFLVTRRGTALSADELQAEILALTGFVNQLTAYVVAQFADLRGELAALRSDLAGLQSALNALKAQVNSLPLPVDVSSQITTLVTKVSQLETQVQSLTTQLNTATSDITTLAGKLTGVNPGDLANALSDIAALQTLVGGIDVTGLSGQLGTLSGTVSTLSSAVSSGDAALQSQINTANSQITAANTALTTAQSQLSFLCSAGLVQGPLLSLSLVGTCP